MEKDGRESFVFGSFNNMLHTDGGTVIRTMMRDFTINNGDIDGAIDIMREVALWCEATGKNMWRMEQLSKEVLLNGLTAENFYIGKIGSKNAAAMILQWYDPLFWPELHEGESGFVHKLCVRRKYSGQGLSQRMIARAIEECKARGIRYLRLDTGWHRPRLCELYESLGFVKVGMKTIGSRDYALYEMKLD